MLGLVRVEKTLHDINEVPGEGGPPQIGRTFGLPERARPNLKAEHGPFYCVFSREHVRISERREASRPIPNGGELYKVGPY